MEADFNYGEVTSDAGVLFLRETDRTLKIIRRVAGVIRDTRHPGYVKHEMEEFLRQRVFQIACGYEDGNDGDILRHDPALKMACEKRPESDAPLASQPTISRLENAMTRTDLYRVAQVLVDVFLDSYPTAPEGIILDMDDTFDETHGGQQLALFNAFNDGYGYQPIHIYEGRSGRLITAILRPGKRPSGREVVAILKRVVKRIRKAWPETRILVRADSHYAGPEVMAYCEGENLKYILGLTPYKPMLEEARPLREEAERQQALGRHPVRLYGEFTWPMC